MKRKALSLITLLVLLVIASSSLALAAQEAPDAWRAKVDSLSVSYTHLGAASAAGWSAS